MSIRRALSMPREERLRRWEVLMQGVTTDDVTRWRDSFVAALKECPEARLTPAYSVTQGNPGFSVGLFPGCEFSRIFCFYPLTA